MTRFIHDQLAKGILEETLSLGGNVAVEVQLTAEIQRIDILFTPTTTTPPEILGLLGQLIPTVTLFEPFRKAVRPSQVRSCQQKLSTLITARERQAKRQPTTRLPQQQPFLWILTPTASAKLLAAFGATPKPAPWPPGVYELPSGQRTGIVAIHQLPRQPDTLWLRLLGRDRVQQEAMEELQTLPIDSPLRERVIELTYDFLAVLEARQRQPTETLDPEEQVLFMQLSGLYQKRITEVRLQGQQEGRQEGRQEERRRIIENTLKMRFGNTDEQLQTVIEPLMELSVDELLPLLMQLSPAELIERFSKK